MCASIVIRTFNEAKHLADLLLMISRQQTTDLDIEVVVIDSGSTDGTCEIAQLHGAKLTYIDKSEFSFGRSLNMGCAFATGDIFVFISGHCVPTDEHWLQSLCQPIIEGKVAYSYGRQVGDNTNNFSERRIFAKYFPSKSEVPQVGFFCNNANSALSREAWRDHKFDEELTGLEDMALGKKLSEQGYKLGYVAEAKVFHHHEESWSQISRRFEREAIALQSIMPEVKLTRFDVFRFVVVSTLGDWVDAWRHRPTSTSPLDMLKYRINQYVGSFKGNREHHKLSTQAKNKFFYPSIDKENDDGQWLKSMRRTSPNEGQ